LDTATNRVVVVVAEEEEEDRFEHATVIRERTSAKFFAVIALGADIII
jgi:hypothetical protein